MHMCHVFSIHDEYVVYIIFMLLLCRRVTLLFLWSHCWRELYVAVLFFFSYPGVGPPCGPGIEFVKELSFSAVYLTIAAGPSSLPGISGSERATFRVNGAEARAKYL